ncbi:MAG: hypothetical protein H0T63_00755 [Pyrinomonadaceae bacterium]|jgi:hypothetical protein|nr:hypothetical protein [Pyrinomonadaceae bacterium]MDQ3584631.1 hypothetical protein [Acidobacteriota bacterium]
MVKNKSIKVIKRSERVTQGAAAEKSADTKKTTPESAREMVATVSNWVTEFQQKRRNETTQAIKTLFPETTPQPSEA